MNQSEEDEIKMVRRFERADFNKFLKRKLAEAYPDHKFSVKGSTGTAWSYIHVKSETVSHEKVRSVIGRYDSQDRDPMTDYGGSGWKISIQAPYEEYLRASAIWNKFLSTRGTLSDFINHNYSASEIYLEIPEGEGIKELSEYLFHHMRNLRRITSRPAVA